MIDFGGGLLDHVDASQSIVVSLRKYESEEYFVNTESHANKGFDFMVQKIRDAGFKDTEYFIKRSDMYYFSFVRDGEIYHAYFQNLDKEFFLEVVSSLSVYKKEEVVVLKSFSNKKDEDFKRLAKINMDRMVGSVVLKNRGEIR
jgi:hypothetical protein